MTTGNDGARADARKRRIPQPDPDGGIDLTAAEYAEFMDGARGEARAVMFLCSCGHAPKWHHDTTRGCGYHGFSDDRCQCDLSSDQAVETIVTERLRQVEAERDSRHDAWVVALKQVSAAEQRAETVESEWRRLWERVQALAEEWDGTVYKLPADHPMTVNEFCAHWFKRPLREALGGDDA
jgi:hypothetical protein